MRTDSLIRLQEWFVAHCDGDREHTYGIRIATLDNPGWKVSIDLEETELAAKHFESVEREIDELNWIHCRVRALKFEGYGGPQNLQDVLEIFLDWAEE